MLPSERGKGIARALTAECLRRSRAWEATKLQLHTMQHMAVTRGMYERI